MISNTVLILALIFSSSENKVQCVTESLESIHKGDLVEFDMVLRKHFQNKKNTRSLVSSATTIDTLWYVGKEKNDELFIRIVDLEYVRVVEGIIYLEVSNSNTYKDFITKNIMGYLPYKTKLIYDNKSSRIVSDQTIWVIDKRFPEESITPFNEFTSFEIQEQNKGLLVEFNQIIPESFLKE